MAAGPGASVSATIHGGQRAAWSIHPTYRAQDGPRSGQSLTIAVFLGCDADLPIVFQPLQVKRAQSLERNAGADAQVLDRPRRQGLTRAGFGGYSRRNMQGDARVGAPRQYALARMQSSAQFQAQWFGRLMNRQCTSNCASRAIKRDHETVAGGIDLDASKTRNLLAHRLMVSLQKHRPTRVPQFTGVTR